MSKTKPLSIPFITPFGILRYPNVSQPDTKGKYADGKFKTDIVFSDDDFAVVEKAVEQAAAKLMSDAKSPRLSPFIKWEEGKGIRLKSQYRPAVFDTRNKKLPESVIVGAGTIARIAAAIFAYRKRGATEIGIRFDAVQVKELVEYGRSPFEETEGFTLKGRETNDAT